MQQATHQHYAKYHHLFCNFWGGRKLSCGQMAIETSWKKKASQKIAAVVLWQTGDHTLQYTWVIIAATQQGGGDWALMCSKFSSSAICLWGRPFITTSDFNTVVAARTRVRLISRLSESNFFTSSQSTTNQVPSGYLEEVFEWKLAPQSTQQPISCFCFSFTPDIQAEAPHRILFSYQCTIRTWLSVLPPTQTFTLILVGYKTILFFLLKLLSCNLMQNYVGYLLISYSVFLEGDESFDTFWTQQVRMNTAPAETFIFHLCRSDWVWHQNKDLKFLQPILVKHVKILCI